MKSIKLFLLLLLLPYFGQASSENHLGGARSNAMAKTSVSSFDIWANYNNQAALAKLKKIQLGVFYENRFQIEDLSTKAIALYLPTKLGGFNLNYSQFGSDLYKESKIGFGYSKALGQHFWASVQLNQMRVRLNQVYGEQSKYNFEIGLLAEIFSAFYVGFHLFNPTQEKFETLYFDEAIPTVARLGFSWHLSKETMLNSEVEKDFDHDIRLKVGFEHKLLENLFIRLGVSNHPDQISFGLGYQYKMMKINLAYSKHQNLGYTPSFDLNISF
ncbi:hypothetical protein DWB61_06665 [Ancylomarina euxinus]|uniref:DUF3316 domain-containing protein n=1 Tax=Ancylomarina euxinus TaxID=2283627 RepID=A0A425Y3A9_9BACT|nr:hypothetical protein [Ancylomarina euxinus]MCZ4693248.1 hypothetical protein [Ancylomarina euxinus]MUP15384.1 hypothetical protein [Ancylomarina euxinus]RRG22494.1 hypothetical protein DWB61_06665 [Ancylomarina euxinus]